MLYFDCASTFRPSPEALTAYLEVTNAHFGNSNSTHGFGRDAARILENSREEILRALSLEKTHNLIFTSGATEANNLALRGTAFRYGNRGKRILVSPIEHPSVTKPLEQLAKSFGFVVEKLPVDSKGVVSKEGLKKAMGDDVILVSVMSVNNETGTIEPLQELADIVHSYPKAFFHTDATQAIGKIALPFGCADLISFSGHKFGALKGSGALLFKKSMHLLPQNAGGEQENGLRGGTVNVAGAKALSVALVSSIRKLSAHLQQEQVLADYLKKKLLEIDEVSWNSPLKASPYVCNFSLTRHKASVVIEALSERGIYCSSVSACSSKGEPVSEVLLAMGKSQREAGNSIRVSMPPEASCGDIDAFVSALQTILKETRPL